MNKKALVGCSHVVWFNKLDKKVYDPEHWKRNVFFGATSMPIFHEKMVKNVIKASKTADIVYLFPFRSVAFNTIHGWMGESLKLDDDSFFERRMDHKLYSKSVTNESSTYIDKSLLKKETVVNIQNTFYKKWLSFYERYDNIKFVFWCHFGAWWGEQKENARNTYDIHLSYPDLINLYPDKSVDIEEFANNFEGELFGDGSFHPSEECRLAFIDYLESIDKSS